MDVYYRSHFLMLQKIRENPYGYLKQKSLEHLSMFLRGFNFRDSINRWEKTTGLDFIEHFDDATDFIFSIASGPSLIRQFSKYVCSYYGREKSTHGPMMLISKHSSSEEEAFDKFFELHDAFIEHMGIECPFSHKGGEEH